jgi:tetratricopeptide (TPR) repeat protein
MRAFAGLLIPIAILLLFLSPKGDAFLAVPIPNMVRPVPTQVYSVPVQPLEKKQTRSFSAIRNMADRVAALGEYAEAEDLYREALTLLPQQCTEAGYLHDRIAQLYARQSKYAKAESEWFKAFQILVRTTGSGSPTVAVVLESMGWANENLNRMDLAKLCYEKALVIQQKTGAPEFLRASTMRTLANIYLQQKQTRRAQQLLRRADLLDR